MNYTESLEYLRGTNRAFCKPGTERVQALCAAVGNPEADLPVIHVTGTNGKGSFCVLLASLLRQAGYRVGRFTSPALIRINESIAVNGEEISDGAFAELVTRLAPLADALDDRPTEFEILTVAAFTYFAQENCDFVLLECGMGGAGDATDVIASPLLSVITGVSLDHADFLGNTVAQIAAKKAGIIKQNGRVLWCGSDPDADRVIRSVAAERNATVHTVARDTLHVRRCDLTGTVFDFNGHEGLFLSLLGLYQADNAANALTALELLKVSLTRSQIDRALGTVRFAARFELLRSDPPLIADGAHNPEGIARAAESLRALFSGERMTVISGILADKDTATVARTVAPLARHVYTVTPPNPRALSAEKYAELFRSLGVSATPCSSVGQALALARADGNPTVCLGSLYTYAVLREALG